MKVLILDRIDEVLATHRDQAEAVRLATIAAVEEWLDETEYGYMIFKRPMFEALLVHPGAGSCGLCADPFQLACASWCALVVGEWESTAPLGPWPNRPRCPASHGRGSEGDPCGWRTVEAVA